MTVIGTTSKVVSLAAGAAAAPVDFDFMPAAVTSGSVVTFATTQVSPNTGGFVFYHVGACDFSPACVTPSPFKETNGTTPPLDSFRRNGVSAIIFDTRPLPPPPIQ